MSDLSKQYHSLIIGDKNTWDDWHLIPSSRPLVNPPEIEENYIKIAGKDGFVDLSELFANRPIYGKRTGSWEFYADPNYAISEPWDVKYSAIMAYLHGRTKYVILEDDPNYYYEGRLKVNQWKSDPNWSIVTIDYTLQPYKRSVTEFGSDEWEWDPFDFENSIIEDYHEILVTGTKTVSVLGSMEPVVPTIVASGLGQSSPDYVDEVVFEGETYSLSRGDNVIPQIVLKNGENTFEFSGLGKVSIKFRKGWL